MSIKGKQKQIKLLASDQMMVVTPTSTRKDQKIRYSSNAQAGQSNDMGLMSLLIGRRNMMNLQSTGVEEYKTDPNARIGSKTRG